MTTPVIGSSEDFLVKILTGLGGEVSSSVLDNIAIDDKKLAEEAIQLPQLLFYYSAAFQRMSLKIEQIKLEVKEAEAREYINLVEKSKVDDRKMTANEIEARITLLPGISVLRKRLNEVTSATETVSSILTSLRQKGYSLQMVTTIRTKEEDWLKSSFYNKFANNPDREKIWSTLNKVLQQPSTKE